MLEYLTPVLEEKAPATPINKEKKRERIEMLVLSSPKVCQNNSALWCLCTCISWTEQIYWTSVFRGESFKVLKVKSLKESTDHGFTIKRVQCWPILNTCVCPHLHNCRFSSTWSCPLPHESQQSFSASPWQFWPPSASLQGLRWACLGPQVSVQLWVADHGPQTKKQDKHGNIVVSKGGDNDLLRQDEAGLSAEQTSWRSSWVQGNHFLSLSLSLSFDLLSPSDVDRAKKLCPFVVYLARRRQAFIMNQGQHAVARCHWVGSSVICRFPVTFLFLGYFPSSFHIQCWARPMMEILKRGNTCCTCTITSGCLRYTRSFWTGKTLNYSSTCASSSFVLMIFWVKAKVMGFSTRKAANLEKKWIRWRENGTQSSN